MAFKPNVKLVLEPGAGARLVDDTSHRTLALTPTEGQILALMGAEASVDQLAAAAQGAGLKVEAKQIDALFARLKANGYLDYTPGVNGAVKAQLPSMLPDDTVPAFRADLVVGAAPRPGLALVTDKQRDRSFTLYDFEVHIARLLNGKHKVSEVIELAAKIGIPVTGESLAKFVGQMQAYGFLVEGAPPPAEVAGESGPWAARNKWSPDVREMYQSALRLFRQGRPGHSLEYLDAILEVQPSTPEVMELKARVEAHLEAGPVMELSFEDLHGVDEPVPEMEAGSSLLTSAPGPRSSAPRPKGSAPRPAPSSPRPAASPPKPSPSSPRPAPSSPRPAPSSPRPALSPPQPPPWSPRSTPPRPGASPPSVAPVEAPAPPPPEPESGVSEIDTSQAKQEEEVRTYRATTLETPAVVLKEEASVVVSELEAGEPRAEEAGEATAAERPARRSAPRPAEASRPSGRKSRRGLFIGAGAAALLLALAIPIPATTRIQVPLEPLVIAEPKAPRGTFAALAVKSGTVVEAGAVLATLDTEKPAAQKKELEATAERLTAAAAAAVSKSTSANVTRTKAQLARAEKELAKSKAKLAKAKPAAVAKVQVEVSKNERWVEMAKKAFDNALGSEKVKSLRAEAAEAKAKAEELQKEIDHAQITAPAAGVFVLKEAPPVGAQFDEGTPFGTIADAKVGLVSGLPSAASVVMGGKKLPVSGLEHRAGGVAVPLEAGARPASVEIEQPSGFRPWPLVKLR